MNGKIQGILFLILMFVTSTMIYLQTPAHADYEIVPLYRLWNHDISDHMYTTNSSEINPLVTSAGYMKEGITAYVYSSQIPDTIPIYQLYYPENDHFYTTNRSEANTVANQGKYVMEGIIGYVYQHQVPGTTPIYRLYNLNEIDHFYTADPQERQTEIYYGGYADEGILGYAYLFPSSPDTNKSILPTSSMPYTQENTINIPQWIKNTAKWWANDKISDGKFLQTISFLTKTQFITIKIPMNTDDKIPRWVRTVASFWTANKISDNEFRDAIQYLIQTNTITISKQTLDVIDNEGIRKIYTREPSLLFTTFAYEKDLFYVNGKSTPLITYFDLKPELMDTYSKIAMWEKPHTAVVVVPLFTSTAYWSPGFYDYYRGECDTSCLTKKIIIDRPSGYSGSHSGFTILKLLGYDTITDVDIDENPQILKQYDKVIVLHNEYVTKKEFDAITHHPKVIYLYANPLYAEVSYDNDTLTLLRGHGYPTSDIRNAFGWKFDNSEHEYDANCQGKSFHKIDNGIMLDCYPENIIYNNMTLLKFIKDY